MKQPVRYFAIGLFTASLILFIAFFFIKPEAVTEEESIDKLISTVEANGYRVISESEYITLSVNPKDKSEPNNEETSEPEEKKDDKNEKDKIEEDKKKKDNQEEETDEKKKKVKKYTLVIKDNTIPSTVSDLLAENKIIDNAAKFSQYLEDEGYSQQIQIGKHKLTSDMSMKEIAEELINFN